MNKPPANWPFPIWNGQRVKPTKPPKPPFNPTQAPDALF